MFWPTMKKAPIGIESTTSIFDSRDPFFFFLVVFRSLLLGQLYPSLYDLLQWSVAVELFFLFCLGGICDIANIAFAKLGK